MLFDLFFVSLVLFFSGLVGFIIIQRNLLIILLCLELMILACALQFIFVSKLFVDPKGQLFALLLIAVSAAETAIGLGLVLKIYRVYNTVNIIKFNRFRY
jgi:NADH-quinone oxidoreductase subunit K